MTSISIPRKVMFDEKEIVYHLEQKPVKNLNLRIRKDGSVYVSANDSVPVDKVDEFVVSKGAYILSALQRFQELAQYRPQAKQYISGETFCILGRGLRLKVVEGPKNAIHSDGVYIFLQVKDTTDVKNKERIVVRFLDQQCKDQFGEIMAEIYPLFQKYGVAQPTLRIRDMDTRWGSCLSKKGIITLNKRLLEAPRSCIEYVVMHEFCHFIHPNHSKQFYGFLAMLMPDWKERKVVLDKCAEFWL
ncbi:M48 family metallopeptidase [Lachnotalea sp. AF33-28]|uniref:M48 family metallopeptidase n=1 Tax=Lachnotalea sp. AF33-28 TaxID=2292046 RepID=UPI000E554F00|nr:SprT family zinc-dependent metalloprotease [Lachnotalea sp. AF33-28]RHP34551.1 M48 family peptidase [Lachnotalea sp. AF33-28]